MLFHLPAESRENIRMGKAAAFVFAVFLSIVLVTSADTGSCEIPKIARGSLREEKLGDWTWKWEGARIRWERDRNYVVMRTGNTVSNGTVLWLYCDEPYSVHGNGRQSVETRCDKGRWTTELQCLLDPNLRCPELPEDGRTIIRYNMERRVNSNVSFSCPKKGQELIGKPVLTCLRSGEWSDSPPYCSGVRCKELTSNDLLQIDYSNEREIGSHAAFHCPLPGIRSGVALTLCREDGTWADPTPTCKKREESRIILPNVDLEIPHGGNPPGTNMESSSPQPINATNNPECFCTYAYKDSSVKVQTTDRILAERDAVKLGETVSLECQTPSHKLKWENGLVFYGKAYMTCSICKEWQRNDLPICTPASRSCKVPSIENGEMGKTEIRFTGRGNHIAFTKIRAWENVESEQAIILRCKNGYIAVQNSTLILFNPVEVTCNDGAWSKDLQCKKNTCYTRDLNYPGLAKPPEEYFDSSESFEINCERGYRKTEGNYKISCNRGRWDTPGNPCTPEIEESTIIPPRGISQGGNPPGINMESSSPQPINATNNPECFCTYAYKASTVKVQTTDRILAERDAVKLGETVSLECQSPSRKLKWKNGLVFYGKAYMTCSTCKEWQRNDLPICTRASRNTYITYDGHFKILPGGIIDMQRGESRQFECRSIWGPPKWDFKGRRNIRTESYQLQENGEIFYISYLNIYYAFDLHNGEYQCFLKSDYGYRVGSSFLRLQVHDWTDSRITTQPSVNVESSSHQTSEVKPDEDCFCTYEYQHQDVIAHTKLKALTEGDIIRRGERVSFECKYAGMALIWQNGLRLNGKAHLICSTCEKWQRKDVPFCQTYERSEPVITFAEDLNVLPGGTTIVKMGERNQFHCFSTFKFPEWDYGQRRGVSVNKSEVPLFGNVYYVSTLIIGRTANATSGEYECYLKDEHGQRIGSTSLRLQAYEEDILCPEIHRSGIFTLKYSNQRRVNSTVTFFCKDEGKMIKGHNILTCQSNGTWSGQIPKCVDNVSCPEFILPQGLTVTYSKNLSVGSIASFECSQSTQDLNSSSTSRCQEDGSWSNPSPFCEDQKCSINDLVMSVPEDVDLDLSQVSGEYVTLGFEVKLKCADKSVITGDRKALCEKQGKWKIGSFQCVTGCILDFDPSSHLLVEPRKEGYRTGERILLSCPPGEELSSDVEQLMCLSKFWSDSFPNCIKPNGKSRL